MAEKVHTYVLDTSVLLSDPGALLRFAEHHIVIPLVVVSELEAKRHHPELGFTARKALHILDDFRSDYDRLDEPIPVGDDEDPELRSAMDAALLDLADDPSLTGRGRIVDDHRDGRTLQRLRRHRQDLPGRGLRRRRARACRSCLTAARPRRSPRG